MPFFFAKIKARAIFLCEDEISKRLKDEISAISELTELR